MSRQLTSGVLGRKMSKFPQLMGTSTDSSGSASTIHTISIPTEPQDGDVLVVIIRLITDYTFSDLAGFTFLGGNSRDAVLYRVVSAPMDASYTIITNESTRSVSITYLIRGVDGVFLNGIIGSINPPEITPPWGNFKNMYIAWASSARSDQDVINIPDNYINPIEIKSAPGLTAVAQRFLVSSHRLLQSAAENPSPYIITNIDFEGAGTIAIKGK